MTYQLVGALRGAAGLLRSRELVSRSRSGGARRRRIGSGRTAVPLLGMLLLASACSSSNGSEESSDTSNGPGDGDSGDGDGDEVQLGTGSNPGSGGNLLGGDGDILAGDGDSGDGGTGDDVSGSGGVESGSGGNIPPIEGTGGAAVGGGEALGSGGDVSGTGGSASVDDCAPNENGAFVVEGETVLDEKTCLTWMRDNTSGDPYAEAVLYCDSLVLGGYDDWRIPTAGEVATIFKCDGMWPPIDDTVFNVTGDGIWTSTESGTVAGDLPKVCGAGQSSGSYYDFGQVGGQNTRCVRGASTVPDRPECKTDTVICQ